MKDNMEAFKQKLRRSMAEVDAEVAAMSPEELEAMRVRHRERQRLAIPTMDMADEEE